MAILRKPQTPMRFESMLQADVPTGRAGKHHAIVEQLLNDKPRCLRPADR